jgi:hypothetical protein
MSKLDALMLEHVCDMREKIRPGSSRRSETQQSKMAGFMYDFSLDSGWERAHMPRYCQSIMDWYVFLPWPEHRGA